MTNMLVRPIPRGTWPGRLLHPFDKLLFGGSRAVAALDKVHFFQGRHPVGGIGFRAGSNLERP
jgi:hypothetical protein